jgi:hypothetical protein
VIVGLQLWVHQDVREWLTGLRDSDPGLARVAGEAVLAMLEAAEIPGPPLVIALRPPTWAGDRPQDGRLQARRAVADVATSRKRIELHVNQLDSYAARLADEREQALAAGREDLASQARARETSVLEQLSGLRRQLASLTSEEHRLLIAAEEEDTRPAPSQPGNRGPEHAIKAIALRPGAPDHVRSGLLFVLPDPDTAVLLAQLSDPGASPDDYHALLSARLAAAGLPPGQPGPASHAPGPAAFTHYDAASFLDEFFAGQQTEAGLGAAALLARHRRHTLAEVRQRMELTQAHVAQRMNVRQERVSAIERADPGAIEIRTLAAYVAALGGSLEITARFDGEPVILSASP